MTEWGTTRVRFIGYICNVSDKTQIRLKNNLFT